MRVTIACPIALIPDANQLALCLGLGQGDGMTYGAPIWQDARGNLYAVASAIVPAGFAQAASATLAAPAWGADLEAAARAQSAIAIGLPAAPGRLAASLANDPPEALAALGLALTATTE
jgi:hypothetical protein